jgi:hypothetical protein
MMWKVRVESIIIEIGFLKNTDFSTARSPWCSILNLSILYVILRGYSRICQLPK